MLSVAPACGDAPEEQLPPRDLAVHIDTVPGEYPNVVDLASSGTLDIAVLGRADFDATAVDPALLAVRGRSGTAEAELEAGVSIEDVDGDGIDDAVVSASIALLVERGVLGPDADGVQRTRIELTGATSDGDLITGDDVVVDSTRVIVELPALTGAYQVARTEYEWTDPDRTNVIGSAPNAPRRVKVEIYYPVDAAPRAQPAAYFPSLAEASALVAQTQLRPDLYESVATRVLRPGPVADPGVRKPLLVFAPTVDFPATMHQAVVADAASHGFVVALIHHPYLNGPLAYADGTVLTEVDRDADVDVVGQVVVDDMSFVVDQLELLDANDERFAGTLDTTRIGALGVLGGGGFAPLALQQDGRFVAGLNIDGFIPDAALMGVDQPFMLVNSKNAPSMTVGDPRPAFLDSVVGDAYVLVLPDADGFNFTDLSLFGPLIAAEVPGGAPPNLGTIDPARTFEILGPYVRAFLTTYVAGTRDTFLDEEAPFEDAVFFKWE